MLIFESESLYFDLSPLMLLLKENTKNISASGAHEKLVSLLPIVGFIDSKKKGPKKYENFYVPRQITRARRAKDDKQALMGGNPSYFFLCFYVVVVFVL